MKGTSWRACFVLASLLILAGGPLHPGGTMADMLAHPNWVPAHALMLAGFTALLGGLWLYRVAVPVPASTRPWLLAAIAGTIGQVVEMAMHTAAAVDHANLVAGRATPVLTTHLWLAVVLYPIFGVTLAGFIVVSARDRVLGSQWIAWAGVAGVLAHGISAPLVVAFELEWARVLFPLIMLFAIWLLLAAFWPVRVLLLLMMAMPAPLHAQEPPPALIQFTIERLKPNAEQAYDAIEIDLAKTCARFKCLNHYLALETVSGPKEVWWLNTFASEAAQAAVSEWWQKNTDALEAVRAAAQPKQALAFPSEDVPAAYRRDLSDAAAWRLSRTRFFAIGMTIVDRKSAASVFQAHDGRRFIIVPASTRDDADRLAGTIGPGTRVFAIHPSWSHPAKEWVAADPDFWKR